MIYKILKPSRNFKGSKGSWGNHQKFLVSKEGNQSHDRTYISILRGHEIIPIASAYNFLNRKITLDTAQSFIDEIVSKEYLTFDFKNFKPMMKEIDQKIHHFTVITG